MSVMADMRAALNQSLQAVHGGDVVLRGPRWDDRTVTAVHVGQVTGQARDSETGRDATRSRSVSLMLSDVGDPRHWSHVVVDDEAWRIVHPPTKHNETVVTFNVQAVGAIERSRPGQPDRR